MFDEIASPISRFWSIDTAAAWIEMRLEESSDEPTFLEGLFELYGELVEGSIVAHGSVKGASLGPISRDLWLRTSLIPYWPLATVDMKTYRLTRYSVLFETYKEAITPAPKDALEKLTDEEFEKYLLEFETSSDSSHFLPQFDGSDSPDPSITIERVFFYSADVLKRWPAQDVSTPREIRKGRVHARISETLAAMPVRGGRRGDALLRPGPYSYAQLARLLIKIWLEQDGDAEVDQRNLERALVNYYKRIKNTGA